MTKAILITMVMSFFTANGFAMEKVAVWKANPNATLRGVETFNGDVFKARQLKLSSRKKVRELFAHNEIELMSGQIIYPEEIQNVFLASRGLFKGRVEKAPHHDD